MCGGIHPAISLRNSLLQRRGRRIEVSLRRRSSLFDLSAFVDITPSYWLQLRVQGRSIRVAERLVDDLFSEVGLRAEEWVGIDGSNSRLAVFGSIDAPKLKMVFCLQALRQKQRCDLLLPIADDDPTPALLAAAG